VVRAFAPLFLTAGDAGLGATYAHGRENGVRATYAQMAGQSNQWTTIAANANGFQGTLQELNGAPRVEIMFLGLPDGSSAGTGYGVTGNESLLRLESGAIPQIHAIYDNAAYTSSTLISTLANILNAYQPDVIRTQARRTPVSPAADHTDHLATAYFVNQARQLYARGHVTYWYTDNPIWFNPENLNATESLTKQTGFLTYAPADSEVCQSLSACGPTGYAAWFPRRYIEASEFSGGATDTGLRFEAEQMSTNLPSAGDVTATSSLYVPNLSNGSFLQFVVSSVGGGPAQLRVRFSSAESSSVDRTLSVNGVQSTVPFAGNVTLGIGAFSGTAGQTGFISIDHVVVDAASVPVLPGPRVGAPSDGSPGVAPRVTLTGGAGAPAGGRTAAPSAPATGR
jgi:LmbE family N-acetylglucosaminyl deacetylase